MATACLCGRAAIPLMILYTLMKELSDSLDIIGRMRLMDAKPCAPNFVIVLVWNCFLRFSYFQ